jgi:hypothetical protein
MFGTHTQKEQDYKLGIRIYTIMIRIDFRSCISNNNPTDFSHGKYSRTEDVSSNIDPAGGLMMSRELAERLGQVRGRL